MNRRGPSGGVLLAAGANPIPVFEGCTCGANSQHLTATAIAMGMVAHVHIKGCASLHSGRRWMELEPTPKPAKTPTIVLHTGQPWIPTRQPKRKKEDRKAASNYKLVLQFLFQRPINIDLWKRIKAPRGWRKCPTAEDKQLKYYGVRFQCRDLKYALTPDELEELRARLYLCLEEVF